MWQRLFPDALASCHGLIAHKLTQAIGADVKLGPDLTTLLAPDWQWITHCLDDHLVALPTSGDIPLSLAQLDEAAKTLRRQFKSQKTLSRYYFVDCVLAELQHGPTLNGELFTVFKKLTLLCAISLTRLNLTEQIAEDGSVDAALRNVRLAAAQRRGSLLTFLSGLDIKASLETLIDTIEDQRPEFAKNKTLTGQVDSLLRVLERLAEHRIKRGRGGGGGAHCPQEHQRLEFSPLTLADDRLRITHLNAIATKQGRRGSPPRELEVQQDTPTDQETWLIEQLPTFNDRRQTDPRPTPPWWTGRHVSNRVALSP